MTADKGKNVILNEEVEATANVAANEEVIEEDVEEATRRSLIENYAVEGESSRASTTAEDEKQEEEELVDYRSSPEMTTPYDSAAKVLRKMEEENVLSVLNQHLEGFGLSVP